MQKYSLRLSASAGVLAAMIAFPGAAEAQQAHPGDAKCPIVAGVANCSGDLKAGITYTPADPAVTEIQVTSANAPIDPGYFAIGVNRSDRDIKLTIANGITINNFDDPAIGGPAQGVVVISAGHDVTIDSGATITQDGRAGPGTGIGVNTSGAGSDLSITNRGNITTKTNTQQAAAINAQVSTATGTVAITNSGALTATSGGSGERNDITSAITINGTASPTYTINNSGNLAITTGPNTFDTDFVGEATAIITNSFAATNTTTIVNSGTITGTGPNASGIVGFSRNNNGAAPSVIDIQNTGAITLTGGESYGIQGQVEGIAANVTIVNKGALTLNATTGGIDAIRAIATAGTMTIKIDNQANFSGTASASGGLGGISIISDPVSKNNRGDYTITNTGAFSYANSPIVQGMTVFSTAGDTVTARITNSGNIDASGTISNSNSWGIYARFDQVDSSEATGRSTLSLTNSGSIRMGSGTALTLHASDIAVTNSGALSTTGANSAVVDLSSKEANGSIDFATTASLTASGSGSDGIRAVAGNVAQVTVGAGATVQSGSGTTVAALRIAAAPVTPPQQQSGVGAAAEGGQQAQAVPSAPGAYVNVAGALTSAAGTGLLVADVAALNLTVANGGAITGGLNAITSNVQSNITLGAGSINGTVVLSSFGDVIDATAGGGKFTGAIAMGDGNDVFRGSGTQLTKLDMGDGDDLVELSGLVSFSEIQGGSGTDIARYTTAAGAALSLDLTPITINSFEQFIQDGPGQITFTGSNSFTTAYELRSGTLVLNAAVANVDIATLAGSTLSLGGATRNVSAAGTVTVDGGRKATSASVTIAGGNATVTGAGSVWTVGGPFTVGSTGSGTLVASNGGQISTSALTLGGGGTSNGTLTIGGASGGAAAAAGVIDVASITLAGGTAANTILFNHTAATASPFELKSAIGSASATNAIIRQAAGATLLSGNSAGFLGTTQVDGGALLVGGTLGGTVNVGANGLLGGTGTVGTTTVAGTLSPGRSAGTLNVNGNITFAAGSTFLVELNANGTGDRVTASGTATINGGTVRVATLDPETSYVGGTVYRFLQANGGRTGTFTGLSETSAFLDFTLGYDATGAFLTVAQVLRFPDVAQTPNQIAAAGGLAAFGQTAGSDSLAVYNALLITDAFNARAAFNSASGEIYASTLGAQLSRGAAISGGLIARANVVAEPGWGIWGGGDLDASRVNADGNGAYYSAQSVGGSLGIDYRGAGNGWAVGILGGRSNGNVDLIARLSRAETDSWNVGGYVRYGTGGAGLTATASVAYLTGDAAVARTVTVGAVTRTAGARTKLDTVAAGGELRYGLGLGVGTGGWSAGPLGRIVYASSNLGSFTESGANSLNLNGAGTKNDRVRYGGGGFVRWQGGASAFDLNLAYMTGDRTAGAAALALAGSPATPFVVRSAVGDKGAVALGVSGLVSLGGGWSLGGNVDGTFGSQQRDLTGTARVSFRF
ncbi:beta strand repeat-containing protein [Sphingomonas immobilis]|uniref:Autotransporter domain-containing protein n=1 Tax=Sphingomonas immobilis TaxID=3063997 RepID=A0ABT8ZYP4_9SPHN|nr:autotransporter domain-containing protein [Sphingomonas sp. CA1-15]MDO7842699.1 autotransporter domain-containing protein [Sphingomonas sp. CA1-15]